MHGIGVDADSGAMAYNQINSDRRYMALHRRTAQWPWRSAASYGAAILAVSWPIHLKYSRDL